MKKTRGIKNSKKHQLENLLIYSLTALTCSLFCSSPFWFPSLCSSMKVFLPKVALVIISPKLLFIVGNLIVVILIGESKFFTSDSSPVSKVYYDEYISKRTRGLEKFSSLKDIKGKKEEIHPFEEKEKKNCEDGENMVERRWVEEVVLENNEREELDGKDDHFAFPAEELSKRADDFIARVNRRRRLEARLSSCGNVEEKKNSQI